MFSVAKTVSSLVLIVVMLFTSLPPTTYAQVSIPTMTSLVSSLQSLLVKLQGTQKAQVSGATNLVAAYGMNEGSGTTITDASGSGPSGTMVGSPDWSTGRYGNALTFGAGDNVNLGSLPSIQGIQRMTLSAWMKRASQNAAVLVGKEDSSGSNSLSLGYWTDGNLYFGLGGSGNYVGGSFQQNDTSWHHVALVFDGTQTGNANRLKGYVDGQQVTLNYDGTVPAQTTAATNPFGIGSLGGAYTSGQIDEVRVYTRTLSQAEIQSDMNTPLPGGTTTTPAFVNTGLTSGTAYRYRVRAEDQAGNLSAYSTPTSGTTLTVTPTDTTAPTLSNIQASGSADAATVTGTTNEPARLRVDYGLTPTSLTSSVSTTTLTTAHTLTLPGLTRRTTYSYRLTVTDQAGNSTQSTVRSFTTGKGKTAPIKNLNAVYGSVLLSWSALEDPFATTIAIHRTTNGTFPVVTDTSTRLVTLSDKTTRTYRDTTAKDGTTYSYTLYAIDDEGTASDGAMITFTPKAPTSSGGGGGGGGGGGKPKPKPTPVPTPTTPTLPSTPVITPPTTPSTPTTVTTPAFTTPLFLGSQNAEVLKLQQFLISQGFLASDSATGLYGPATEAAVKRYQCARSIVCGGTGADTGYGLVGNATRTQLNREVKGTTTTVSTPTTTTTTTLTPEARQVLIQSLLQQLQVLMARLQAMRGS